MSDETTPSSRPEYRRPEIQTIGSVAELTLGGNGNGTDAGKGKGGKGSA